MVIVAVQIVSGYMLIVGDGVKPVPLMVTFEPGMPLDGITVSL
jgi:hypothetical protein